MKLFFVGEFQIEELFSEIIEEGVVSNFMEEGLCD